MISKEKNKKTITMLSFLSIFGFFLFFLNSSPALAQYCNINGQIVEGLDYPECSDLNGDWLTTAPAENGGGQSSPLPGITDQSSIGDYVKSLYTYAIGIVGILATVVIMIGGLIWLSSMGNAARVGEAKAWIGAALTGLLLAMTSYTLLYIVNPNLVKFEKIGLPEIDIPDDRNRGLDIPSDRGGGGSSVIDYVRRAECPPVFGDKCRPCNNCREFTMPVSQRSGHFANESLVRNLEIVYRVSQEEGIPNRNWQITEAWPPAYGNHQSNCHKNGGCVDINFTSPNSPPPTPQQILDLSILLNEIGTATYETNNCNGLSPQIICSTNHNSTAPHFHFEPN